MENVRHFFRFSQIRIISTDFFMSPTSNFIEIRQLGTS